MFYKLRRNKTITTVIIIISFIFLTGCGNQVAKEDKGTDGNPNTGGMGRYMEDVRAFPEEINRNGGLNILDDGSMTIISFNSGLYRSTDDGASWQWEETDYFPMMQGVYAMAAVMAPDGTAAITCSGAMPQAARKKFSGDLPEDWEGNYCIFAFPSGEIQVMDFGFSQEDGSCISTFVFKSDGRLFAGDMNGRIYEVDMEHESLKELFMMERETGYIGFCGDILMAVSQDKLYLYDLEQQVLLTQDSVVDDFIKNALSDGTVRYTGGGYPLAVFGGEENIIYIACAKGLYRHALGGSVMEQIIDGALSTFGDGGAIFYAKEMSRRISGGDMSDKRSGCESELSNSPEFLVQFNPSGGLIRYYFDESIPAMPDKEIRIYALEENSGVRQAVTSYKKEHTDRYVRYEVGVDGENGVTAEDAMKRLNTQILSGEGPDVIILDGLPIDSYLEKGLLADISEVVESKEAKDALFPNLVESFRQKDRAIYAMPLCIQVPLLVGDTNVINRIEDIKSFADEMETLRLVYPQGGLLGIYDAQTLLKLFGMVSSVAWTDEVGQIVPQAIEEFLAQVKRIYEAEVAGILQEEVATLQREDAELLAYGIDAAETKMEACNNVLNIRRGYAKLACGYVDGIQICLDNITSVIKLEEDMSYQSFSAQIQNAFLPKILVGMSAQSAHPEDAKEFIGMMFSAETQGEMNDGFPINQAAFVKKFDFYESGAGNGSMTFLKNNGTEEELELLWPSEAEEEAFTKLVRELKEPIIESKQVSELVYEVGIKVLEGSISVERAIEEITKRAAIYLAE